jgi:hypothetical protein
MKKIIRKIVFAMVKNRFVWACLYPLVRLGQVLQNIKNAHAESATPKIQAFFADKLEVQNGCFKGLRYPRLASYGSSIYPKLVGSYEKELEYIWKKTEQNTYTEILNIGCAEGYYAVGLGKLFPTARLLAYDTSRQARTLCEEMAILNGVKDRLTIKATCVPEELASFAFVGKGLIVCDCEGYEKTLFQPSNLHNLLHCDLIIETHDFEDIDISAYLKQLFAPTHEIISIKSLDDIEKAHLYHFEGLENFSLFEKKQLFAEYRPAVMEWIVCFSKKSLA